MEMSSSSSDPSWTRSRLAVNHEEELPHSQSSEVVFSTAMQFELPHACQDSIRLATPQTHESPIGHIGSKTLTPDLAELHLPESESRFEDDSKNDGNLREQILRGLERWADRPSIAVNASTIDFPITDGDEEKRFLVYVESEDLEATPIYKSRPGRPGIWNAARDQVISVTSRTRLSLRIESAFAGCYSVVNIGPLGNTTMLHPAPSTNSATLVLRKVQSFRIDGIRFTPPLGIENLLIIRTPNPAIFQYSRFLDWLQADRDTESLSQIESEEYTSEIEIAVIRLEQRSAT